MVISMTKNTTSKEFIEKFDYFHKTPSGTVVIHPNLKYNLIELNGEFVTALKHDLRKKIMAAHVGLDELDPTTKFAIMMLEDAF